MERPQLRACSLGVCVGMEWMGVQWMEMGAKRNSAGMWSEAGQKR